MGDLGTNDSSGVHHEEIRNRFRPKVTRLLLVGESPPANGTFFYSADSNLYRYTVAAFTEAGIRTGNATLFLDTFRDLGCFLDDLCHRPVNNLPQPMRRAARNSSVPGLASRLQEIRPRVVVCVMRAIEPAVRRALRVARMQGTEFRSVPFPAQGHQLQYVEQLAEIVGGLDL